MVFPASVLDDYSIHRPYEIPPLILFTIALMYLYKKRLYLQRDVIYKGILIYLIIDIFSQIIMSYSIQSFDTAHNLAHVLKDVGYFVNIIALAVSGVRFTISLKERNELIKNQYEGIKTSEKIKDEFINIAAHELRTPIQPILAFSIFLSDKNGPVEEYKEHIDIAFKLLYEDQEIDLKQEFDEQKTSLFIYADRNRILQVISNVLINSVKFTKKGNIVVLVRKKNSMVLVQVKDSGPGIDRQILPKLFDKFITVYPSGTGLGLYICKSIVETHGGKIWAENNQNNVGASFSFTLPADEDI